MADTEGVSAKQPKPSPFVGVIKFSYLEMLREGPEDGAAFRSVKLGDIVNTDFETLLNEKVFKRIFPFGIDKAFVDGHDYLVLNAIIDGTEVNLMPGALLGIRADGHVTHITTTGGVPDVEISEGKLIIL